MDLKKVENLEFIEDKLMEIRDVINLEDAYQVCDAIIVSIDDELLQDHIADMLKAMGYQKSSINKVCQIVKQIQNS
jgi:deoxyhypusine synthase